MDDLKRRLAYASEVIDLLLDVLVEHAPAQLALIRTVEIDAMDDRPMTDDEDHRSRIFIAHIDRAFERAEATKAA
ncbi:MAG: hypothetical protein ABI906_06995 [Pseudomonadota bacterium]